MDSSLLNLVKKEYTSKLCSQLSPCIYDGIIAIWNNCKNTKNKSCLMSFQQQLSLIPKWNTEIISNECSRINSINSLVDLEKILEAVFLINIKVLSTMIDDPDLNVTIPNIKNFIHKVYINCAREFYINPYIVDDRVSRSLMDNIKIQKNIKYSIELIDSCIEKTVQECIPIQDILEKFLNSSNNNYKSESDSDSEVEPENDQQSENGSESNNKYTESLSDINEEENEKIQEEVDINELQRPTPNLDIIEGDNITNIEQNVINKQNIETETKKIYSDNSENSESNENLESNNIFANIDLNDKSENKEDLYNKSFF